MNTISDSDVIITLKDKIPDEIHDLATIKEIPQKIKDDVDELENENEFLKSNIKIIWNSIDGKKTVSEIVSTIDTDEVLLHSILGFLENSNYIRVYRNRDEYERLIAKDCLTLWSVLHNHTLSDIVSDVTFSKDRVIEIISYLEARNLIQIIKSEQKEDVPQEEPPKLQTTLSNILENMNELALDEDLEKLSKDLDAERTPDTTVKDMKEKRPEVLAAVSDIIRSDGFQKMVQDSDEIKNYLTTKNEVEIPTTDEGASPKTSQEEVKKSSSEILTIPPDNTSIAEEMVSKEDQKIDSNEDSTPKRELSPKEEMPPEGPVKKESSKDALSTATDDDGINLLKSFSENLEIQKRLKEVQDAETEQEKILAEQRIVENVHDELKEVMESGAGHEDLKNIVSTLKNELAGVSTAIVEKQSKVLEQVTSALGIMLQKIEDNSKRLETIAESESKKIDMLAEELTDGKFKRKKIAKKEIEQYLSHLKTKKSDEGEDRVSFD